MPIGDVQEAKMQSCLAWLMSVRSAWTTEEYMLAATANDCGATANATISQATYDPHGKRCLLSVASAQSPGASAKKPWRFSEKKITNTASMVVPTAPERNENDQREEIARHTYEAANQWKCSVQN